MTRFQNDVQAQRRGIVEIAFQFGKMSADHNPKRHRKVMRLRNCLPIKVNALHMCINDPAFRLLVKLIRPILTIKFLSRVRIHNGSTFEMLYSLLSYGIPLGALPINQAGVCSNEYHMIWLQQQRDIEQRNRLQASEPAAAKASSSHLVNSDCNLKPRTQSTNSSLERQKLDIMPTKPTLSTKVPNAVDCSVINNQSQAILVPDKNDCILGRGQPVDQHYGNVQFRLFLQDHLEIYETAPHYMKHKVGNEIQRVLQEDRKVRFLKIDESGKGWKLANDSAIREKILRTFRRLALKQKRKRQTQ